jgi:photosystem II stability/assembly factor-like uncharacterized protein
VERAVIAEPRADGSLVWAKADGGLPREATTQGFPPVLAPAPGSTTLAYIGWPGGLARTEDGGAHWSRIVFAPQVHAFLPYRLFVDGFDPRVLFANGSFSIGSRSGCGLARSGDRGRTWRCIDPPGIGGYQLARLDHPGGWVVLGNVEDQRTLAPRVWRTEDRGNTWRVTVPHGLEPIFPLRFFADPVVPQRLYVSAIDRLLRSVDGGAHWIRVGNGLPSSEVFDLAIDPSDPRRVYALLYQGVFESRNAGGRFGPLNGGLPPTASGSYPLLQMDPQDPRRLFVGLAGHGVYELERR